MVQRCQSSKLGDIMGSMAPDPIIVKYPNLFDLDSVPWNSSMQFGLRVESVSLRNIIEELCVRLQPIAVAAKAEGLNFRILGVKQKFGTLRISYRGGNDEIDAEIERAKDAAFHAIQLLPKQ
jgi:hypothetical protein